jgi:hypothetical protein
MPAKKTGKRHFPFTQHADNDLCPCFFFIPLHLKKICFYPLNSDLSKFVSTFYRLSLTCNADVPGRGFAQSRSVPISVQTSCDPLISYADLQRKSAEQPKALRQYAEKQRLQDAHAIRTADHRDCA